MIEAVISQREPSVVTRGEVARKINEISSFSVVADYTFDTSSDFLGALLAANSAAFLAANRYSAPGLEKYRQWEIVWERQREECVFRST
jgi:hypothetical protein